jgi:hypothetical protein
VAVLHAKAPADRRAELGGTALGRALADPELSPHVAARLDELERIELFDADSRRNVLALIDAFAAHAGETVARRGSTSTTRCAAAWPACRSKRARCSAHVRAKGDGAAARQWAEQMDLLVVTALQRASWTLAPDGEHIVQDIGVVFDGAPPGLFNARAAGQPAAGLSAGIRAHMAEVPPGFCYLEAGSPDDVLEGAVAALVSARELAAEDGDEGVDFLPPLIELTRALRRALARRGAGTWVAAAYRTGSRFMLGTRW